MADENRIITFQYAKNTWDEYKKQTIPDSLECMTKDDVFEYLSADMSILSSYAGNQLVPRSKFLGIPMDPPNSIKIGPSLGYGGGDLNNFSDSRWNAVDEPTALATEFGYAKVVGFKIYLNRTLQEMFDIITAYSNNTSPVGLYYPVFLDNTNKHLVKKIRVINADYLDPDYPSNDGLVYDENPATRRKISFINSGNSFTGSTAERLMDLTVPPVNSDTTLGNIYIGFTRINSGAQSAKFKSSVIFQILGAGDTALSFSTIYSPDEFSLANILSYDVEFRNTSP